MASSYPILAPHETLLSILCVFYYLDGEPPRSIRISKDICLPNIYIYGCMLFFIGAGFIDELRHGCLQPVTPHSELSLKGLRLCSCLKPLVALALHSQELKPFLNAVPIFREGKTGAIKAYVALGGITSVTLLGFAYHLYMGWFCL